MRRFVPILAALLGLAVSCTGGSGGGRDTIPLVKAIAADSYSPEHILLSSFSKVPSSGDICIAGTPASCAQVSRDFTACDIFENARGREWSDDLKDFAGETFACICDSEFTPYERLVIDGDCTALRTLAVNYALAALSSECSVSRYDLDGNCEKAPAKIIILADPWLFCCGKSDIDTLFTLTGCKVPVISPQELMLDAALGGNKKYFNSGILCDSLYLHDGIYKELFSAGAAKHDIVGARCFIAATDPCGTPLASFLDAYIEQGGEEPLDAIMVDDWNVDIESLESEVAAIRDFSREEHMRYGRLLSPGFAVFSSSRLTMSACYKLMRERNLFTHRIASPEVKGYTVWPLAEGDGRQFLLIPSENVQD